MTDKELIQALKRSAVPDNHRCLGCGYEHNCGINGCQINIAAEKRIRELLADTMGRGNDGRIKGTGMSQEETTAAVNRMEWICVKDKMPPGDTPFLGYDKWGGVRSWKRRSWGDTSWLVGGCQLGKDVTHWMPLPEPPVWKEE